MALIVIRNILAVIIGFGVGSAVNMGLITLGHKLVPLPADADVSTMESLAAAMPSFGPEQFIFPFLAHALGTLVGAVLAYFIAGSRPQIYAYVVTGGFFLGGITAASMLPAPAWYNVVDLLFAYVPMGWLACQLGTRVRQQPVA